MNRLISMKTMIISFAIIILLALTASFFILAFPPIGERIPLDTVYGRVTDEAGNPIGGARVYAELWLGCPIATFNTITDDDGYYILSGFRAVAHSGNKIWAIPPEETALAAYPFTIPPEMVEDGMIRADIILKKGGSIYGMVYDDGGNPITDTHIGIWTWWPEQEIRTVNGSFTTGYIAPGIHKIVITPLHRPELVRAYSYIWMPLN